MIRQDQSRKNAPASRSAVERPRAPKPAASGNFLPDARPAAAGLAQLAAIVNPSTTNRTGLPPALKAGVESLSGVSLDHVRVHRNSSKPAQLSAHAFAQGSDIHLAPGQEKHLPHEAWHVVQQAQGRVKPTAQLKGIALNDDSTLEREADVMGQAALRSTAAHSQAPLVSPRSSPRVAPVQALFYFRASGTETRLAAVDDVVSLLQESGYVPENHMDLAELVKKLSQGPDIFFEDRPELVRKVQGRLSGRAGAAFALGKAAGGSAFRKTYRLFGAIMPLRYALTGLQHALTPAAPTSASAAAASAMSVTAAASMGLSAAAASSSTAPKGGDGASAGSLSSASASASAASSAGPFNSMFAAAKSLTPDMAFLIHESDATLRGYKAKEILRDCDIILTNFSALLDEHPAHGDFRHFWTCFNILSNFGPLSYAIIADAHASGVAASQLGELNRFAEFILENLRDIRQGLSRRPTLAIIAHRGTGPTNRNMGGLITQTDARRTHRLAENSPDAFRHALTVTREALSLRQPSLDGIECDVYLSRNHVPIVTHEGNVLEQLNRAQQEAALSARSLTRRTEVHQLTDAQLRAIPRNASAGSRFMTLAELLDLARDTAIAYFQCTGRAFRIEIEMKGTKAESAAGHGPLQPGALRDATARVVSQAVKRNRGVPVEYVLFNGTEADLPGFSALRQTKTALGGLFTGLGGESTPPAGMNPAHVDELRYGFNKDQPSGSGPLLPNTRTNLRQFIVTLVFAQEFAPRELAERFVEPSEDIITRGSPHRAVSEDIDRRRAHEPTSTEVSHQTLFEVLRQLPPDLRLHLLTDYPELANWIKTMLASQPSASAAASAASSSSGRFGSGSLEQKGASRFVPELVERKHHGRASAAAAAAAATAEEDEHEPAAAAAASRSSSSSSSSPRGRGGQQQRGGRGQQQRGRGQPRGGGRKPRGKKD